MGLQVGAILRRIPSNNRYQFVLRWLADDPTNLPAPSDSFQVRVSMITTSSTFYLRPDGTFDPSSTIHNLTVSPRNYAMIDPPRITTEVESAQSGAVQALNPNDLIGSFYCTPLSINRDHYYSGRILKFTSGVLQDEFQIISDYVQDYSAGAHLLSFAEAWSTTPAMGDQFVIEPIGSEAIASMPTGPVDCSLDPDTPLPAGVGLGICNLLKNTQPDRIRSLAASRLKIPIRQAVAATDASIGLRPRPSSNLAVFSDRLALNFARFLVDRAIRPKRLLSWLDEAHAELVLLTSRRTFNNSELVNDLLALESDEDIIRGVMLSDPDSALANAWELLHILVGLVSPQGDPELIDDLETLIYDSQQARRFLSLRALQGGSLVDFWCSPDVRSTTCADPNDRGQEYPAATLAGLGLAIGQFTDSDVDSWLADRAEILVEVQHQSIIEIDTDRSVRETQTELDGPSFESQESLGLGHGEASLTTTDIRSARNSGTSLPPTPPSRGYPPRINYDLLQSNVADPNRILDGANAESTHFRQVTGDGLIQILMRFESAPTIQAGGFNVYGMWENASTAQYFTNPHLQPSLNELKPWLMTRRYSYSRDLATALPQSAIDRLNQVPPDEPVFFRPAGATDHGPVDNQTFRGVPLPANVQNPDSLVFSFDLRRGMNFPSGWDPRGRIATEWNPHLKRDGSSAGARPQGYRFWVTSVDLFGQESAPVPVQTNDSASNSIEEFIYRPVYRTPLPPPVNTIIAYDSDLMGLVYDSSATVTQLRSQPALSDVDDTYNGRSVEFISGELQTAGLRSVSDYNGSTRTFTFSSPWPSIPQEQDSFVIRSPQVITVRWETPFLTPAGRRGSDPQNRLPQSSLQANVQLFRRPTSALSAPGNPSSNPSLPDVSQWQRMLLTLRGEGWQPFRNLLSITGSGGSPAWSVQFTGLQHTDKGFAYLAAISIEVISPEQAFWAANIVNLGATSTRIETECPIGEMHDGRCVQGIKSIPVTTRRGAFDVDEYRYELAWELAAEYPIHSEVARTEPTDAANLEEPRGVEETSVAHQLFVATHVLPVGPIRRDAVLTRLLTSPFDDGNIPDGRHVYQDTDLELSAGQAAMIDTALSRSQFPANDARLADTRRLLAMEAVSGAGDGSANAPPYLQHSVVGFRGLLELSWTYTPSQVRPLLDTEAEADGIVIEQVRVPRFDERDTPAGNVTADGLRLREIDARHFVYELRPISSNAEDSIADMAAIIRQFRSGALRLDDPNGRSLAGVIIAATTSDTDDIEICEVEVEFLEDVSTPPDRVTAHIYFSSDLTELSINRSEIILPVGGGPAELICWTINTISATGRRTSFTRRQHVALPLPATIEPPAPTLFTVLPPTNDLLHALNRNVANERQWLPRDLVQSSTDLTSTTPHLVATWKPLEDPEIGVAIVRHDFVVGGSALLAANLAVSVWDALIAIETQPDNLPLQLQWLNRLVEGADDHSQRWLLGEPVNEPNQSATEQLHVGFRGPTEQGFLSAKTGIRLVAEPGVIFTVTDSPSAPTNVEFHAADTLLVEKLYEGGDVEFLDGALQGQRRPITDYVATSSTTGDPLRKLQFSTAWPSAPAVGDPFVIHWKAGFIDYYRLWNNDQLAMTVDYEYDYRICHYIDLNPQFPFAAGSPLRANTRFLRSNSSITLRGRPQTAPINITIDPIQIEDTDLRLSAPVVIFRFLFIDGNHLRSLTSVDGWRYRITVRRVRFFSLPSDPAIDSQSAFDDIGSPLSVTPDDFGSGGDIEVRDENLERPDFNVPFAAQYEILISQFATIAGQQERLIRSPQSSGLIPVQITSTSDADTRERVIIRLVKVR